MNITINGKSFACEKGEFLLDIARRNGIPIPTLCHHDGLPGQGCCRVCAAEVIERGRSKIVVSCAYPVSCECEVFTDSEKVRAQRGVTLMLLGKRAPGSERIAALCEAYGAPETRRLKEVNSDGKCIMCGLCVRACAELGAGAISTVNRGVTKEIATPYHEPSSACVGCGSCAGVCPTRAIEVSETARTRRIWERVFQLEHCKACGAVLGTSEEITIAAKKAEREPDWLCDSCRQKRMADVLAHTYGR